MRRERLQRLAPTVAVVLVALLAGLSFGTGLLVLRHFKADATATSRLYSGVFGGLNDPRPGAEAEALLRLGAQVRALGLPLVITDGAGASPRRPTCRSRPPSTTPGSWPTPRGWTAGIRRSWTRRSAPCTTGRCRRSATSRRSPILQGLTIAVMVAVAVFAYRSAMAAQRDRLWVAMAREAAHQMGTPLTSLQGWIERVRSRPTPPPGLADHLAADAERLDRVAQRFERIGNPAKREPVGLGALADRVAGYFRPRLPKHANPIELKLEAPGRGPMVLGDAGAAGVGAGSAGEERHRRAAGARRDDYSASRRREGMGEIRVMDDGPGVRARSAVRSSSPASPPSAAAGASASRSRGAWSRTRTAARSVLETTEKGACFVIRIPLAESAA